MANQVQQFLTPDGEVLNPPQALQVNAKAESQGRDKTASRQPVCRVLFVNTSMPVGGAETLLVNLVRQMDTDRFSPEICCLKAAGPLGEEMSGEVPVFSEMLAGKYDLRVFGRLVRLMRGRRIDAVVTVGAGDKMFWGRLAAWRAGVPVVLSALHSTGWPDNVGRLNRMLSPITDRFIAVADGQAQYLSDHEGLPAEKVVVIPNGVDTERFRPNKKARQEVRRELRIGDDVPVFGLVAALRPEKNHMLFLQAAERISREAPEARFVIVGDGTERQNIEEAVRQAGLAERVLMLGNRDDVPDVLAALDVFLLSSLNEASPVSILEALAVGLPVVATRVGSVAETVQDDITGFLVDSGDAVSMSDRCVQLASDPQLAAVLGENGRAAVVDRWSLRGMVRGYERLISRILEGKQDRRDLTF